MKVLGGYLAATLFIMLNRVNHGRFTACVPQRPALHMLHRRLGSWRAIGIVAAGIRRQGWDLQFIEYGDGHWRPTFYAAGMAHSIVGARRGSQRNEAGATQRAGWQILNEGGCDMLLQRTQATTVSP